MNKGIVMSITRKWATVLTDDCRLVRMNAQPNMTVGEEIPMNTEKTTNATNPLNRGFKFAILAVSVICVLVIGLYVGKEFEKSPVYATVSVDVNPSVEFSLNRDLLVMSAKALNEEAEILIEGLDFEGMPWQDAITAWIDALRETNQYDLQDVLISAVMPEDAVQLQTELMKMEGTDNPGSLAGVQVRFIYSNDASVTKAAIQNGLSVGRQMLLNQSMEQNQNWDKTNIAGAALGELVQTLLRTGDQNQTRITDHKNGESNDPSGEPMMSGSTETNRETEGSNGDNAQASGSEATQTNQNMNQETNHNTDNEPSGSTATGSAGSQQNGSNVG